MVLSTLRKYFSHPSLVMCSLATPPIKLKLGQQIGGGLLIANHLDQALWWANQKYWAAVRSYLLHSFLQVHSAAAPLTSYGNMPNYAEPKPFLLSQTGILWIFFIQFFCIGSHTKHHRWRCVNNSKWLIRNFSMQVTIRSNNVLVVVDVWVLDGVSASSLVFL